MFLSPILKFLQNTGFSNITLGQAAMIGIALILLYLSIVKKYEPILLMPLAFGILLGNLPLTGLMAPPSGNFSGGLLYHLFQGVRLAVYPPLIFLAIGALTDFGPLIANPKTLLLGAAAQFGIFTSFIGALMLHFTPAQAASIGIIGGADGPTAIFLTTLLAPELLAPIAVAAYAYIALVPLIQPPIILALTTKEERAIRMEQTRPVNKTQKILFPILVSILVGLILPTAMPLIGMMMFGNLLKESRVVDRLAKTVANQLNDIVVIFLTLTVGASASAERFFTWDFIVIVLLGLFAFMVSTAAGILMGKLFCKLSGGKINPLIGGAGVSAVPEAARLAQKLGREANPTNFLLMHAMGPNVAGVLGSAIAAGVLLSLFGG